MISRSLLYFHSVRRLKPVQIYSRVLRRFRRPAPDLSPPPPRRSTGGGWVRSAARPVSLVGEDRFRFLNQEGRVAGPNDWNDPAREKLWLYNLHYFDDLCARSAGERRERHLALIRRWIRENRPGEGNGWEPYPLSLRIVNWIRYELNGHRLPEEAVASLAVQTRYLFGSVEWHLLGNHLLANAKALLFAGTWFEGPEAERWRTEGARILARELPEQVLPDGGHFELSPMYHVIILEDLLDLLNLMRAYPAAGPVALAGSLEEAAGRMRKWLAAMIHPDGEISFFNDAAMKIALPPEEVNRYSERLGLGSEGALEPVQPLVSSGYVRLSGPEADLFLDVGRIGPDYLPGHAHADSLTWELSLFGRRVLVNSGVSCYGQGEERLRQRGTAAHNTVVVDGRDSSEVWAGFRVARRANPGPVEIVRNPGGGVEVRGSHDGYRRLPGRPVHHRCWKTVGKTVTVSDRIEGTFREAEGRFHFHPDLSVEPVSGERRVAVTLQDGRKMRIETSGGRLKVLEGTWHPEFGLSVPNRVLVLEFEGPRTETIFRWS